ncbi:hypothetical protein N7493_009115 [Penicillium malachiteum]|uniref:Uncharacterized protein n=1 Tax=Penicillium malachiteum TaxID=1324776 RepID=A0AAD6HG15_9EURO|nr:hypothetical protein N7493_009115 [Penicillium malachiteum]
MSLEQSTRPTTEEPMDPGKPSSHKMSEKAVESQPVADEPQSEEPEILCQFSDGYLATMRTMPIIESSNTKNDAGAKPQSSLDLHTTIKSSAVPEDSASASSKDSSGSDSEIEAPPFTNEDSLAQVPPSAQEKEIPKSNQQAALEAQSSTKPDALAQVGPNAQEEEIPKSNQQAEFEAQNDSEHELIDSSDNPSTQKQEEKSNAAAGPVAEIAKDPKTSEVKTAAKSKPVVETKKPSPKKTPDKGKTPGNEKSTPKGAKKNDTAVQEKEDAKSSTEPKQGAKAKAPPKSKAAPTPKASGKSSTPGDTKESLPDNASRGKPGPKKKAPAKSAPAGKDEGGAKEDASADVTRPGKSAKPGVAGQRKGIAKPETPKKSQNPAKLTSKSDTSPEVDGEADEVVKPKITVQRKSPAKGKAITDSTKSSKEKETPIPKKSTKLHLPLNRTKSIFDSDSDSDSDDAISVPKKRAGLKVVSPGDHKDSSTSKQTAKLRETEVTKSVQKRKVSDISEPTSSSSVPETPKKRKVSFDVSDPVSPDPHHPIFKELRSTVALISGIESIEQELDTPKYSYVLKKLDSRDSLLEAVEEKMNAMSAAIYKAPKNIRQALIRAYTNELGEEPRKGSSWNEFDSDDEDPLTPIHA